MDCIITVDGVFQLRLKSVGICQQYNSEVSQMPDLKFLSFDSIMQLL